MKYVCIDCDWYGESDAALTADHPFIDGEVLTGCPQCKEIGGLRVACDEPGCYEESTIGTPTKKGYRRTCHKHRPSLDWKL